MLCFALSLFLFFGCIGQCAFIFFFLSNEVQLFVLLIWEFGAEEQNLYAGAPGCSLIFIYHVLRI